MEFEIQEIHLEYNTIHIKRLLYASQNNIVKKTLKCYFDGIIFFRE